MAEPKFDKLELSGRHVPDYSTETGPDGHKHQVELPGFYEVGFVKDGAFRAIHTLKAAGLFADIERAKAAKSKKGSADKADAGEG